ncbi:hypothetical protein Pcinc_007103 [Petrolisthes cinctipes]|uniref:Secreted protein n=1 Tax=Petrolisthes cinctipes TaxID=88211 RepID=A0AAE1GA31_PETCI|nr:hypothetical protein Pcinc_007103 [Petrolisthes cinctipes]
MVRVLLVTVVVAMLELTLLPNPGRSESMLCYVCMPSLSTGNLLNRDAAAWWRGRIARTWPNVSVADLGWCDQMTQEEKFVKRCDYGDVNTACVNVTTSKICYQFYRVTN